MESKDILFAIIGLILSMLLGVIVVADYKLNNIKCEDGKVINAD